MWVRHLAWLHATPSSKAKGHKPQPRYEVLKARNSPLIELPQLDALAYLIDWLGELGICGQGFNGPVRLTYTEIQAWQMTTGLQLPAHEAMLIRRLSEDYCAEYAAASDPARPAPYSPDGPIKVASAQSIFAALRQATVQG